MRTRDWWVFRQPRRRSSVNFSRAAKAPERDVKHWDRRLHGERKKAEFHARVLMTEAENLVAEPVMDGGIELWKLASKKMIDAFHNNELILAGE